MARIENNDEDNTTELFIDGEYQAGWMQIKLTDQQEGIVCSMIETAVRYGEQKKAEEIRKALRLMQ